jgi:deazaflavin-dependent oxidoreductase (nitroreductase family)
MRRGDFKRWLYRGQRPNWIARMENRAWAALFSWGLLPDSMVTLEVTGRKSGRTVTLPMAVTVVNGKRYLVSMLGEDVQWVHNVRAAGGRAVFHRHGREEVHLEEVPADQRAPILRAYLQRAPGARPHVPVNKDAPLAAFEQIATAFPVFQVVKESMQEGAFMKRVTRNIDPSRAQDLLERAARACLCFATNHGPQAQPVVLVWQDGRYLAGIPEQTELQPDSGEEVVLLLDEGIHFFDLRALYIRGRLEPAETPRDAPSGHTWGEVVPLKTVAWDYGMLREVSDEH